MLNKNPLRLAQALLYRWPFGTNQRCVICQHALFKFLPYNKWRIYQDCITALEIVGSDLAVFECPWCGSHDRERHLLLYLQNSALLDNLADKEIIHFAPEQHLAKFIQTKAPRRYVRCDLFPADATIEKINMLDISYPPQSFDLLIANHVLEHVDDDAKALAEIFRVLKPGGYAILQTPYSAALQATLDDRGIQSERARLYLYGQEDHVRLYGADIFERFSSSGLRCCVTWHRDALPQYAAARYGVNLYEPFFLFHRPADPAV